MYYLCRYLIFCILFMFTYVSLFKNLPQKQQLNNYQTSYVNKGLSPNNPFCVIQNATNIGEDNFFIFYFHKRWFTLLVISFTHLL